MKKRIVTKMIATVAAFTLVVASFTGCGNANSNTQQDSNSGAEQGTTQETAKETAQDYSKLSDEELQALYEKEPASQRTIHVSYDGGLCLSAIPIAQYKGFFEAEGIKTELIATGDDSRDALNAGKVDTAVGMLTDWMTSIQNGVELRFTMALHTGCTSAAVLADSDITKFEKGQKVGVSGPIGGFVHNIGLRFVSHDGFVADDFDWLALDSGTVLSALQKGDADVIVAPDQMIMQWEEEGLVKTIRSQTTDDDFKDEACCAFGFQKNFIEENPVTVYKVSKALYKASKWLDENDENKKEAVDICLDNGYTSGNADFNLKVLKSLRFGLDFKDLKESLDNIVPEFVQLGILKADLDQESFKKNLLVEYNYDEK